MYDIYTIYIVFIFLLISHLKKERLVFRFNLTQMIRVVSNNRTRKVISSNFKKGFRSAENLIALLNLLLRDFFFIHISDKGSRRNSTPKSYAVSPSSDGCKIASKHVSTYFLPF